MLYQARHDSTSEISCIFHHSQNGSFRSHQILKVNCQRITHVGCCIKRKPRENIKVCVNVSRTSYRQATDRLPTHYQQSADCRLTVGRQVAYISGKTCRPTDGQLNHCHYPQPLRGTAEHQVPGSSTPTAPIQARLPKLEVQKFGGNIGEWQEFWDSFESAIDKNLTLADINKFL